jgi:ribonuclease HII
MGAPRATRSLENRMRRCGFARIAGVDEVGRGCLAGPVVAAAVVLDADRRVPGLRDSKVLAPARRERLYDLITARAADWAVGQASAEEIDRLNIHRASLLAMRRAVEGLARPPDLVLVDAFRIPDLAIPQRGVIRGDARSASIAAASIVAKVTRDRLMVELHATDGRYGFDRHKGYATREHLEALTRFGLSAVHRRTFRQPTLFDTMEL